MTIVKSTKDKRIVIQCQCQGYDWNNWGNKYTCVAKVMNKVFKNSSIIFVIEDSNFECVTTSVEAVKITDPSCNYLPIDFTRQFPMMTDLYVFTTTLSHIDRSDFQLYTGLRTLSLSKNDLRYIPYNTFDDMINLEYFSLSINKIRDIPNLKKLTELKELYLFENRIETITFEDLSSNLKLTLLWIQDNKLKRIDRAIFDFLVHLKEADFSNNNCVSTKYPETAVEAIKKEFKSKCFFPCLYNNCKSSSVVASTTETIEANPNSDQKSQINT